MSLAQATARHEQVFPCATFNPRPVLIAGVGAGGSEIALRLAKLGVTNITVVDFDTVSIENVGPSLYGEKHVGMKKVDACAALVKELSAGIDIRALDAKIEDVELEGAVFICVDSMALRKQLVAKCTGNEKVQRIFEGRMGAYYLMGHSLDPKNESHHEYWKRYTPDDEDMRPVLMGCGGTPASVGPTAAIAANFLVELFIQWWADERGEGPRPMNQVRFDVSLWECEAYNWDNA